MYRYAKHLLVDVRCNNHTSQSQLLALFKIFPEMTRQWLCDHSKKHLALINITCWVWIIVGMRLRECWHNNKIDYSSDFLSTRLCGFLQPTKVQSMLRMVVRSGFKWQSEVQVFGPKPKTGTHTSPQHCRT